MATPSSTVVRDRTGGDDINDETNERKSISSSKGMPQGRGRKNNRFKKFYVSGTPSKRKAHGSSDGQESIEDGEVLEEQGKNPFLGTDAHGNEFVYSADDEPNAGRSSNNEEEDDESVLAEVIELAGDDNHRRTRTREGAGGAGISIDVDEEDEESIVAEVVETETVDNEHGRDSRTKTRTVDATADATDDQPSTRRYISRREFKPDGLLTEKYVRDLLGGRHRRITHDAVREHLRLTNQLKADLSRHFKTEVERKMVSIAVKCPLVKQTTFEGLQKLWESLDPKTTTNYTAYEDSFWRITQKRSSDLWPADWDVKQEALYMKRHQLVYKKEGKHIDETKGCIAMMCGLAIRKARRRIWYFGDKAHGRKISAVRPPLLHGKRGKDDRLKRKDWSFREEYVRCAKGENSRLGGPVAGEDPVESDDRSPRQSSKRKAGQDEGTKRVARVRNCRVDYFVDR